ncbi:hypothetical protein KEH51_14925 [[Brevibacterium] frigoritolerans]|uniref:Uncharacterized protein n=1 Tax=Peribacillus frigoritolerans TaxID=450367 RepID=A0A941FLQ4_9BACI|nr:hypothetical protein [Peribacillus frigoritolerans]
MFIGTILICLATAIGNAITSSLIKHNFARNIGLMTGIYVSMNLFGAIGSGISIPLASFLDWMGWCP